MSNPSIGGLRDLQADARLDLTTHESVIIVMMRGQVDEELRRLQAFEGMWSRWTGLNCRPTVYEIE